MQEKLHPLQKQGVHGSDGFFFTQAPNFFLQTQTGALIQFKDAGDQLSGPAKLLQLAERLLSGLGGNVLRQKHSGFSPQKPGAVQLGGEQLGRRGLRLLGVEAAGVVQQLAESLAAA